MGNKKFTHGALAATGLAVLLFSAVVIGADAKGGGTAGSGGGGGGAGGGTDTKQNVMLPMACSNGSNLQAGFNKSGSTVLLGIMGSNTDGTATWTGTATDGAMVRDEGPSTGTDWAILDNYDATKGSHAVVVEMHTDSESCTVTLSFKV